MPFYIALADTAGTRDPDTELMLSPGPTDVEYPPEALGAVLETADGMAIHQQPTKDPRRRAWVWRGYPAYMDVFERQWQRLEMLRSAHRRALGLPVYVYVKDTETRRLRRRVTTTGVAGTGSTSSTLKLTETVTADQYKDAAVAMTSGASIHQVRTILTHGAGTDLLVTVAPNWTVTPANGDGYAVTRWVDDWFKARVLQVSRTTPQGGGNVRFDEARFEYVIDDDALGVT